MEGECARRCATGDLCSIKLMKINVLITAVLTVLAAASSAQGAITGQWNFNNTAAPLTGAVGQPITYLDGPGGATEGLTRFGTASSFGLPLVDGVDANVMCFGVNSSTMGYGVPHGVPANGGGSLANQYTLIMDVLFPASSSGKWRALYQTDVSNPFNDDAEFYLDESNRLGIGGGYSGNVPAGTWVRLAFAVDLAATPPSVSKFINGVKVGEHTGPLDQRFALTPDSNVLLFTDGYEGGVYTQPGYLNSLQVHDVKLSDAYLASLGGPSGNAIPTSVQSRPFVKTVSPVAGQNTSPARKYVATIENAETQVDLGSIKLTLNGSEVVTSANLADNLITVSYSGTGLLPAGSTNTYTLIFSDNGTPRVTKTNTVQFVVANYTDLQLPTALYLENFDSTPEGSLPSGWTTESFTEVTNPEEDLQNLDSASYAKWTVVDVNRFRGSFVTYSDPNNPDDWETDYQRVLAYNPVYVVNGQLIEQIASGRMVFGNSGYRNGRSQVLYLYSPDYNLSGKTGLHLVFHNVWEQNQDSIGAVEYSIDQGQTWQPILYMLDAPDIARGGDGTIDAVTTFTQQHGDVAVYTDPLSGEDKGGNYGAFIGVDSSRWSELGPFISARGNDVAADSKRVETFRLPQADNQANVRFRFAHAGTDSWYFGVDNFGLYSIGSVPPPTITQQPANLSVTEGEGAALSVVATGSGTLSYQWFRNDAPVTTGTQATLTFPVTSPGDTGTYYVKVSNAGGTTQSSSVTLTVNPRPADIYGIWHFNGNLDRAAGSGELSFASPETQSAATFGTGSIAGQNASYLAIPLLPTGKHGVHLTMPTVPNGGGAYLNQYTMVWDVLIPGNLYWTPLFNTNPDNGNDADFYVTDTGALGIGDLQYSPAGAIQADQWYRIGFTADLAKGEVTYYVNGSPVHKRTGGALTDGRFSLYTDNDAGPDILLFTEPTAAYNHPLNVNGFLFVNRTLSADEMLNLNGPKAAGIEFGSSPQGARLAITRTGTTLNFTWSGGKAPYQLQKTTSLTNPQWTNVGGAISTTSASDAIAGDMAFYRVVSQP